MLIQNTVNPPDTNKQNSVPVVQEEATNLPTASSPIQLPSK